jgi:lipopolysaccharide export system protein LptA
MLKALFIVRKFTLISVLFIISLPVSAQADKEEPIIITSQTLIADNNLNTVTFEGTVVAKNEDITIYSDKMEVFYNNNLGEITKIYAHGNVRALKNDRTIFSDEATYLEDEEKIIFTGEPKAVDGENVITGTEIIFFIKKNRTVVKGSRVVLKKEKDFSDAFPSN